MVEVVVVWWWMGKVLALVWKLGCRKVAVKFLSCSLKSGIILLGWLLGKREEERVTIRARCGNVIALRYGDLLNVLRTRLAFDEAVVDVRKHPDNSEGCAVGRGRKVIEGNGWEQRVEVPERKKAVSFHVNGERKREEYLGWQIKWLRKEGGGGSRGKQEAVPYLQTGELIGWVREVGKSWI